MARKKKKAKRAAKKARKGMSKAARRKAGKKAAATRRRNKAIRSAAGKKAARSRKRKGGGRKGKRSSRAAEPRKGKRKGRKGGKRKSRKGKRRGQRMDTATHLTNTKMKLANIEQRYEMRLAAYKNKMSKASDSEKNRLREKLVRLEAERGKEIARIRKNSDMKLAKLEAAERGRRRKGGKRKGKRRGARRNPIGSGGAHEHLATAAGIFTGLLLTMLPYRLIRSHALTPVAGGQGGSGGLDSPAQGDVPNLLAPQLPFWSRLKWRGLIAIATVGALDIALPMTLAAYSDSDGWKTYFQLWGWTGVTLAGAKVVTDVGALALKSTLIGQRLFAPENTARNVQKMSAAAQLPTISVAPGLGMPGLTGYGAPKPACAHVGAGAPCCAACAGKDGKTVVQGAGPGTGEPIKGTTPMPAQPGMPAQPDPTAPGYNPNNPLPGQSLTNQGPRSAAGAAGAPDNVTPINRFTPRNRFSAEGRLR